jgi:exodeoxyribonuclease III
MIEVMCSRLKQLNVLSWNVNGLRALLKHDSKESILKQLIETKQPDFLCLQETKLQDVHVPSIQDDLSNILQRDITAFWNCSKARKGYSGTVIICLNKIMDPKTFRVSYGIGDSVGDLEGRSITIETEQFSLTNVYVPNSGASLERLPYRTQVWDKTLSKFILDKQKQFIGKPVILTGDLNVAYSALDYYNSKDPRTKKQAGTTVEEQVSIQQNLFSVGLFDSYRDIFPDSRQYSYFSPRRGEISRKNREGYRVDFILTNIKNLSHHVNDLSLPKPYIEETICHPYSDHCPIGAVLPLEI